jgi:hypothetical protein
MEMTITNQQVSDWLDQSQKCLQWDDPLLDIHKVIKTLRAVANDELDCDLYDLCRDMTVFLTCLQVDIERVAEQLRSKKKRK